MVRSAHMARTSDYSLPCSELPKPQAPGGRVSSHAAPRPPLRTKWGWAKGGPLLVRRSAVGFLCPRGSPVEREDSLSPSWGLTASRCSNSGWYVPAWKGDVKSIADYSEGRITRLPIISPSSSSPSSLAPSVLSRNPARSSGLAAAWAYGEHLGPGSLPSWVSLGPSTWPRDSVVPGLGASFGWLHAPSEMSAGTPVPSWGCYKQLCHKQ